MTLPPPPPGFFSAVTVKAAKFAFTPGFAQGTRKRSGRRAEGLRYEKRVQDHFLEESLNYLNGPWIRFCDDRGWRWCQPDGLHFDFTRGVITLVEIKYQHTTDSWWQMRRLYEPVLRFMFPTELWKIRLLTVVKWYDPAVRWPEPLVMVADPFTQQSLSPGLHIWRP